MKLGNLDALYTISLRSEPQKRHTGNFRSPKIIYMYANALMPNGLDPYLQIAEHREVGTQ